MKKKKSNNKDMCIYTYLYTHTNMGQANKDNEDVTGKRGADYYSKIIASSKHPERLAGSLPTVSGHNLAS